jgi:glutamate synthase domain-containing protein 1
MYTGSTDGLAKCWVTEYGDNTVTYKGHSLSVSVVKFYKGLCKQNIESKQYISFEFVVYCEK